MRKFSIDNIPKPKIDSFEYPSLPLDIEVGCGVGLHPIQYSGANPDRYLVALEHTRDKFEKFHRRFINHGSPTNLLPLHENAISWISHVLEKETVSKYFFLFPNPNPKPAHQNKRFHAMPFMQQVIHTLRPDGEIIFATNELFYAQECKEFMTSTWKLQLIESKEITSRDGVRGRTHFERKYLERGQTIYNLTFKKS
ncbi:hypothetical protein [Halobacteriovorax sp. HLS]|uniref:hypothetical protein n=1 Tax=Halobacteriovorax sp. HLS TaxID=2234000 RepID=UPI000FD8136B|nr:hypothetical protein [Halobacteriovorax sp. HLS]